MSGYIDLRDLVIFRPLGRRVGDYVDARSAPFRAQWSSTVSLLARELEAHGAEGTVLEVDMAEQDFRLDGLPRADRAAMTPGIALSFQALAVPEHPQLRYEVVTYTFWQDNVRAVALGLQALRAVDRYGVTRKGEQYAGWKQITVGGVSGNAEHGRALIKEHGTLRKALTTCHPDNGGTFEDFIDVRAAQEEADGG